MVIGIPSAVYIVLIFFFVDHWTDLIEVWFDIDTQIDSYDH